MTLVIRLIGIEIALFSQSSLWSHFVPPFSSLGSRLLELHRVTVEVASPYYVFHTSTMARVGNQAATSMTWDMLRANQISLHIAEQAVICYLDEPTEPLEAGDWTTHEPIVLKILTQNELDILRMRRIWVRFEYTFTADNVMIRLYEGKMVFMARGQRNEIHRLKHLPDGMASFHCCDVHNILSPDWVVWKRTPAEHRQDVLCRILRARFCSPRS